MEEGILSKDYIPECGAMHSTWSQTWDLVYRTPGHKDFVVLHVNGIHVLDLDFCGCDGALSACGQLLEVGWWLSTSLEPQSAASMALL